MSTEDKAAGASTGPELDIIENADGTVVVREPGAAPADDLDEDDVAPVSGAGRESDDAPTEQEELAAAATDYDRERIRERRRKERKDRRAAQQERERSLKSQLDAARNESRQLAERLNVIERKTSGSELAQIDNAIAHADAAIENFKVVMGEAANRNDGAAQAEAMEKMIVAREQARDLRHVRQRMANPVQRAPVLDPQLVQHAQGWMSQNSWYNPKGADQDSRFVLAIDQTLAEEGYNPTTPAYWQELSTRVKRALPHRAGGPSAAPAPGNGDILGADAPERRPGKSVVTGSGREAAGNGSRSNDFVLSADRVQALKDAGYWNDPVKRNEMIKDFREYDRKAATSK